MATPTDAGGLSVDIFKHDSMSYSNGGISDFFDEAVIFGPGIDGPVSVDDALNRGVPLLHLQVGPGGNPIATVRHPGQSEGSVGPMFGGTFVGTSDSRFARATGQRGTSVSPLHDRYETADQHQALA